MWALTDADWTPGNMQELLTAFRPPLMGTKNFRSKGLFWPFGNVSCDKKAGRKTSEHSLAENKRSPNLALSSKDGQLRITSRRWQDSRYFSPAKLKLRAPKIPQGAEIVSRRHKSKSFRGGLIRLAVPSRQKHCRRAIIGTFEQGLFRSRPTWSRGCSSICHG